MGGEARSDFPSDRREVVRHVIVGIVTSTRAACAEAAVHAADPHGVARARSEWDLVVEVCKSSSIELSVPLLYTQSGISS